MGEKKRAWNGETVEVLTVEYEKGRPDAPQRWTKKLGTRKEMLAYLETAERTGVAIASFAIGELNNEGTEMPLGIEKSVRYDADYLKTLFPGK
jgi:hypothetical protein